jgi:hypothetical protein
MSLIDKVKSYAKPIGLVLALGTMLGCAASIKRVPESRLLDYKRDISTMVDDSLDNLSLLRDNEYVVPSIVFSFFHNAFAEPSQEYWVTDTIDRKVFEERLNLTTASYVVRRPSRKKIRSFESELNVLNLLKAVPKEHNDIYLNICSTPGNMIYSSRILQSNSFRQILQHERMHKETESLSYRDKVKICKAYESIITKKGALSLLNPGVSKYIAKSIDPHWFEFFPYLANGVFKPEVKERLRNEFPDAYRIYQALEKKTVVKK